MTRLRIAAAALLVALCAVPLLGATPDAPRALLAEVERRLTLLQPGTDFAPVMALLRPAAEAGDPLVTLRAALVPQTVGEYPWVVAPTPEVMAEVSRLAAVGDAVAQGVLGTSYLFGIGVEKDAHRAATLYESSLGGYPWSAHNLGWMYSVGEGVERDLEIALELWRASVPTNAYSEYTLALLYLIGDAVAQDLPAGLALLHSAAARGHVPSIGEVGRILAFGLHGVPMDLPAGTAQLETASRAGFPWAMFNLGSLLLEGPEAVRDMKAARGWFRQCADKLPECANHLGHTLAYGTGSERDLDGALHWLTEATLGGDLYAFGHLLDLEATGDLSAEQEKGVRQTFEQAAAADNAGAQGALATLLCDAAFGAAYDMKRCFDLAHQGAEAGSAQAMQTLATTYWNGFGTDEDRREAIAWWRRAAEAGDRLAAYRLGNKVLRGSGVAKDVAEGIAWLERAANHGWPAADLLLAEIYEYGWFDIEVNLAKARSWYVKAAALNNSVAKGWLAAAAELGD